MKPATAISILALFVALGGTGYAALKLPANSVTTRQVKDHSLLSRDMAAGQLPAGTSFVRTVLPSHTVTSARADSATLTCPAGAAVDGGIQFGETLTYLSGTQPGDDAATWVVHVANNASSSWTYTPWVLCAT